MSCVEIHNIMTPIIVFANRKHKMFKMIALVVHEFKSIKY